MSETNDCGHTDDEHAEMAKDDALGRAAELMEGNFSSMFPDLPTAMIQTNIEAALMEMFLRSPNDDQFRDYVAMMLQGLLDILVPEDGVSTQQELWDKAHEMRDKIQAKLSVLKDDKDFLDEAGDELRIMLEQHGVAEPVERTEDDDSLPGQYL